jgi:thiamine-monophosphate kinase
VVDAAALPIPDEVRRWHEHRGADPVSSAIAAGDDYELLFTVRPKHGGRLRGVARRCGNLPITRIGVVTKDTAQLVQRDSSVAPLPRGFEHFR